MGAALAELTVRDLDGEPVRLGDVVDRPTVLAIPRYYGCLPCRDYLRQVWTRYEELEALGAGAIGLSVGADYQARWLVDNWGIGYPLLVDPDRVVYDAIDLPRRWWVGLNPKGWANYARAIAHGSRQGKIVEPNQLPGLAVLDANAEAIWVHRGRALGDYPKLDSVLSKLRELTPAGSR